MTAFIAFVFLEFAEFFALPPVDGVDVSCCKDRFNGRVYPCIAALPMGFSWSLWIAQESSGRQSCNQV